MAVPLPVLPKGCTATFVGEGNANVVFAITLPASAENGALFRGRLLRVPKAGTKAYPYRQTQAYWEEHIAPLFDQSDLVGQSLVDLTGSDIVSHLNHILSEKDKVRSNGWSRRPEFIGSRVAEVDIGMLVEDMRKRKPSDVVLELKPKWLTQSPRAPPSDGAGGGTRRCRNCAREALREARKASKSNSRNVVVKEVMVRNHTRDGDATGPTTVPRKESSTEPPIVRTGMAPVLLPKKTPPLCPLELLACSIHAANQYTGHASGQQGHPSNPLSSAAGLTTTPGPTADVDVEKVARHIAPPGLEAASRDQFRSLVSWLRTTGLLRRLRDAQAANDGPDVVAGGKEAWMSGAASDSCLRRLELAMTLRDCTIFLRIPAAAGSDGGEGEGEVEAKLGDLDLKNSEAKLGYWMELERDLAEQGFYAGTESPRQTTNCWLERHL